MYRTQLGNDKGRGLNFSSCCKNFCLRINLFSLKVKCIFQFVSDILLKEQFCSPFKKILFKYFPPHSFELIFFLVSKKTQKQITIQ